MGSEGHDRDADDPWFSPIARREPLVSETSAQRYSVAELPMMQGCELGPAGFGAEGENPAPLSRALPVWLAAVFQLGCSEDCLQAETVGFHDESQHVRVHRRRPVGVYPSAWR